MDEASDDSRPAQPGFVKKFFITMSQVIVQKCQFSQVLVIQDFLPLPNLESTRTIISAYMYKCINRPKFCSLTRLSDSSTDFKEYIN